ncbi:hypothetical protein Tco_1541772 [Tanacetum coccineum]
MVYSIQVFQVVSEYAKDRPIFFSIFQRNATFLVQKLQKAYHVCLVKIRAAMGVFGAELRAGMGGFWVGFGAELRAEMGAFGC